MNGLGRVYVAVRDNVRKVRAKPKPEQEALTEAFLGRIEAGEFRSPDAMFRDLVEHAVEHVPYYAELVRARPELRDAPVQEWPILTRDILRAETERLKSRDLETRTHWEHASGGSTGKPVTCTHDTHFAAMCEATRRYCEKHIWGGPYTNQLILWGAVRDAGKRDFEDGEGTKDQLKAWVLRQMGLKSTAYNTFSMTEEKLRRCVRTLNTQKPDMVFGYAGSIYHLAKYMDEHGLTVAQPPKAIGTTAQTLYPFMREKIEAVFQCPVSDHWGSREVGPVSWGDRSFEMYIPPFQHIVEVVDDAGNPVAKGEQGRLLVTTLHNHAMPLIRYDIGDLAIRGEPATIGGVEYSTLDKVLGKENEEFISKNGTMIHGQFFINLFYFRDWIDEFQVVQKTPDRIQIIFVPTEDRADMPSGKADIAQKIEQAMGHTCTVDWEEVPEIPKTVAGKHLYIRSEVPRPGTNS